MRRWRRRVRDESDQSGGQDAFLDIVANLVGILVILVMVIGVRAQDAWVGSKAAQLKNDNSLTQQKARQLAQVADRAADLELSIHELETKKQDIEASIQQKSQLRAQLQVLLESVRRQMAQREAMLGEEQQSRNRLLAMKDQLEAQIATLQHQAEALAAEQDQPIVLEHLPTPMAQTVFGREEHYQLKGKRLVYVPLNELTDQLRTEAPQKIWKLKQTPQVTERLGPIRGFHMRYTLARRTVRTVTQAGPVVRQVAELQQFTLMADRPDLGERLTEALQPNSQFRQQLESFPRETVLTVWTYPDSFAEFRELKRWLYERGFACAARPLPADQPISGSPQGSRSAAQ